MPIKSLGIRRIERVRRAPDAPTSYFKFERPRRHGNSRYAFIDPDRVPDFDGDVALAEIERVPGKPWGHYRVASIVTVLKNGR